MVTARSLPGLAAGSPTRCAGEPCYTPAAIPQSTPLLPARCRRSLHSETRLETCSEIPNFRQTSPVVWPLTSSTSASRRCRMICSAGYRFFGILPPFLVQSIPETLTYQLDRSMGGRAVCWRQAQHFHPEGGGARRDKEEGQEFTKTYSECAGSRRSVITVAMPRVAGCPVAVGAGRHVTT